VGSSWAAPSAGAPLAEGRATGAWVREWGKQVVSGELKIPPGELEEDGWGGVQDPAGGAGRESGADGLRGGLDPAGAGAKADQPAGGGGGGSLDPVRASDDCRFCRVAERALRGGVGAQRPGGQRCECPACGRTDECNPFSAD